MDQTDYEIDAGDQDYPLTPAEVSLLKQLAAAVGEYLPHVENRDKFATVYEIYAKLEHQWDQPEQYAEAADSEIEQLRDAVRAAERGVVDTGSYEIIHLDRAAWDKIVLLVRRHGGLR